MKTFRILFIAFGIIYGIYFCFIKIEEVIIFPENSVEIIGYIDDYPENRISSNRYRVRIREFDGISVTEVVRILVVTSPYTEYKYGTSLKLYGIIELPKDFITDTGKTFDYDSYLKLSSIYGIMREPDAQILDGFRGNKLKVILFKIRKNFSNKLNKNLSVQSSALSRGVLLGEKTSIDNDLRTNLAKTSTSHIIALSGYNITIVSEILMKLLAGFSIVVRSLVGSSGILLFLILTGGGSSAMRAGIMGGILIYSRSRGKTYNALWALTIATTILIIISPLSLRYDVGFHLSVLATFGLVAFQRPISVWLIKKNLYKWLTEILSSTLSATIMTLPYIAYSMGIFSILGIFVNIIVVPLLPLLMLFSFLVGIFGNSILFLTKIFSFITNAISNIILYTINQLGSVGFAALYVDKVSLVLVIIVYVFLFYKGLRALMKES